MRINNDWTIKIGFLLLSLCACRSPSVEISGELGKVNASIDSSQKLLAAQTRSINHDDYTFYYTLIKKKGAARPELIKRADSLVAAIAEVTARIKAAEDALKEQDPEGKNAAISQKLLVHTPLGDQLRRALEQVISRSESCCAGFEKDYSIDSVITNIKEVTVPQHWYHDNFSDQPSLMTLVVLGSLESDCKKAAALTLQQIEVNI